jgi:ParB-like chromosome segregation protein Spo0J
MQIVQVPVASVKQHPDNPHTADMDALEESVEVNGFFDPILVQASTRFIIAGNHRWLLFVKQEIATIPAIILDVDDLQAKRMLLADNRVGSRGHDDEALLFELLQDFGDDERALLGTGYDRSELDELRLLTAEPLDFVEGTVKDIADDTEHRYEVTPVPDSDGNCVSFEIWAVDGRPLTPGELNKVRKGLGMRLLDREEMEIFSIDAWGRKF